MRGTPAVAVALLAAAALAGPPVAPAAAHYPSVSYHPPAVGPDGTLYVAGGDGFVYALAPGGRPVWARNLSAEATAPAVVAGDRVVAAAADGRVVALDAATGDREWATPLPGGARPGGTLAVLDDTVVVAGGGGVHGLALDGGAVRWSVPLPGRAVAGPVADGDRGYVLTGGNATLVALSPDGAVTWRAPVAGSGYALAAGGGRAYAAAGDAVVAFEAGGARAFRVRVGETAGLAAAPGGVVAGTYDGRVVRLREGRVAWTATLDATAVAPAVGPDGRRVYAVTPETVAAVAEGRVAWRTTVGPTVVAAPTVVRRAGGARVYVGTQVNRTYALAGDGRVVWVDQYATGVGTAPGIAHDVSPPPYLDDAAGRPTRVVLPDGTARRPGGGGWPVPRWVVAALAAGVAVAAVLTARRSGLAR